MASLNKVILMGNLTRDPDLRVTPKGSAVCQFGIAVNRRFHDESGASRDEVTYVDVECWGKLAEIAGKFLVKGRPCLVEGRLKFEQWEDKESRQKRSRLKVQAENIQFLGVAKEGGQKSNGEEDGGAAEELDPDLAAAGGRIPF